jgi:hypothetical protein
MMARILSQDTHKRNKKGREKSRAESILIASNNRGKEMVVI